MSQKNETIPLLLALLITGIILGGGFWWFSGKFNSNSGSLPSKDNSQQSANNSEPTNPQNSTTNKTDFAPPTNVPDRTTVRINGSTSMVVLNKILKNSFEQKFPGATVITNAGGTDRGIQDLLQGKVDVAAISRPLNAQERGKGLAAVAIASDSIALVVGTNNPFRRGLTSQQVEDIFLGQINNWSALGGDSTTIRVINRPAISGTYQVFKQTVLKGNNFATSPNFTVMQEDATTPLLRLLGNDGIGYATYAQIANQRTVRTVAIDGLTPESPNYPYQRTLYYAYKQPASPQVKSFLGYALSPQGRQIVVNAK
ncbi:MAG: phosphate ABC transporter substrate-binding protein [Xenococcaceae cyanobacterium]